MSPAPASLLEGQDAPGGGEISFWAVSALGGAIWKRYAEFRAICFGLPPGIDDPICWIDKLNATLLPKFVSSHAKDWQTRLAKRMRALASEEDAHPAMAGFITRLAEDIEIAMPEDARKLAQETNRRGWELATAMARDTDWSSGVVAERFDVPSPRPLRMTTQSTGNFQLVTTSGKSSIELRINPGDFDPRNALLYYLTLDFQMMHEYVSHLLPVWNSGSALEEEYLLAIMTLYFRDKGAGEGRSLLAAAAEERRKDPYRPARERIKYELAPGHEEDLSRLLLRLAVQSDDEMKLADKRNLLALLRCVPRLKGNDLASVWRWIREENCQTVHARLTAMRPCPD